MCQRWARRCRVAVSGRWAACARPLGPFAWHQVPTLNRPVCPARPRRIVATLSPRGGCAKFDKPPGAWCGKSHSLAELNVGQMPDCPGKPGADRQGMIFTINMTLSASAMDSRTSRLVAVLEWVITHWSPTRLWLYVAWRCGETSGCPFIVLLRRRTLSTPRMRITSAKVCDAVAWLTTRPPGSVTASRVPGAFVWSEMDRVDRHTIPAAGSAGR